MSQPGLPCDQRPEEVLITAGRAADLGASLRAAEAPSRRTEQIYLRRCCVSTAAAAGGMLSIQDGWSF